MKVPPATSTPWLATPAPELIDRSLNHGLIGKEGFNELPDLIGESNKRLPETTESLSVRLFLYAHLYISIQITG